MVPIETLAAQFVPNCPSDGLIERDDLELLIKLEQLGQFLDNRLPAGGQSFSWRSR